MGSKHLHIILQKSRIETRKKAILFHHIKPSQLPIGQEERLLDFLFCLQNAFVPLKANSLMGMFGNWLLVVSGWLF